MKYIKENKTKGSSCMGRRWFHTCRLYSTTNFLTLDLCNCQDTTFPAHFPNEDVIFLVASLLKYFLSFSYTPAQHINLGKMQEIVEMIFLCVCLEQLIMIRRFIVNMRGKGTCLSFGPSQGIVWWSWLLTGLTRVTWRNEHVFHLFFLRITDSSKVSLDWIARSWNEWVC